MFICNSFYVRINNIPIYFLQPGFNVSAMSVWDGNNKHPYAAIKNVALDKESDSPAHGDEPVTDGKDGLTHWLKEQEERGRGEIQSLLDRKIFQTNVFFGSIFGFAALLAVLFLGKFLLNIIYSACRYVLVDLILDTFLSLIGRPRKTSVIKEHYFGAGISANRSGEKKKR